MTDIDTLSRVMMEAGDKDDSITTIVKTPEDTWIIRFEDAEIDVEYNAETDRITMISEIGQPPSHRREAVLEAMLTYSYLWRETGGIRMALAGANGEAAQLVDLAVSGMTPASLATAAANLAENTRIWRGLFASEGSAENQIATAVESEMFIRI